jgi:methylglutaconyl-CoA hydratase
MVMVFSECKTITVSNSGSAYYLWLNRPEKRNALNKPMMLEIIEVLNQLSSRSNCRVLVIQGMGDYFCSGADLDWMKTGISQTIKENKNDAALFELFYNSLNSFPKPLLVGIQKGANGGALGIVACADIVISTQNCKFSLPEVKLGLIPAMVAPYIIQKIGVSHARNLMITGNTFDENEAKSIGLVHHICEASKLNETIENIIASISQNAPQATIATKALIHKQANLNDSLIDDSINLIADARASNEGQKGVTAFFEKRKPLWDE